MTELLAVGERYEGRTVIVEGYFIFEFENVALYLSRDAAEYGMTESGVWVSFAETKPFQFDEIERCSGNYVCLSGRFTRHKKGHFGLFSGAIEDVKKITILSPVKAVSETDK